jgi:hypothetical protein
VSVGSGPGQAGEDRRRSYRIDDHRQRYAVVEELSQHPSSFFAYSLV